MYIKDKISLWIQSFFVNAVVAIIVLNVFSGSSHAYGWRTCNGGKMNWDGNSTTMYISTTSFPQGSSWDYRLQDSMSNWNNVNGSKFNFYVGRDTDGSHSSGNGKNEVYGVTSEISGSTLAVTYSRWECSYLWGWTFYNRYVEADIGFNFNFPWNTSYYQYSQPSSPINFEGVALHELGHALGLNHEDRWMATMNSYYPNSGPFGGQSGYGYYWHPYGDDASGIRYLYGDSSVEVDIAASAHKRTGSGTSDIANVSPRTVARGSYVNLEYTFSNLGTSYQSFNIGYYLSTNSYISTSDTLLSTNYGAGASSGSTGTYTKSLFIPSWISPGTYYLGIIVDNNKVLAEDHEGNNAQQNPYSITVN